MAKIKIEGGKELAAKLKALETRLGGKILKSAVQDGADLIERSAREKVPIRTGLLKRSIDTEVEVASATRASINIGYDKLAWYGHMVEGGTLRAPAKPFLRPSLDENQGRVVALIMAKLKREVMQVASL